MIVRGLDWILCGDERVLLRQRLLPHVPGVSQTAAASTSR